MPSLVERGLKVAAANASAGYHYPHSAQEIVRKSETANTLNLFVDLGAELGHRQWTHEAPPYVPVYRAPITTPYRGWLKGDDDILARWRLLDAADAERRAEAKAARRAQAPAGYLTEDDPCPMCGKCQLDASRADQSQLFCWHCSAYVDAASGRLSII
jgi:hypothetical protein